MVCTEANIRLALHVMAQSSHDADAITPIRDPVFNMTYDVIQSAWRQGYNVLGSMFWRMQFNAGYQGTGERALV